MAGQEVVTCIDEINRFLDDFPYERNNGDAIFIHKSILPKFCEKISSTGWQVTDQNTWPYKLRIGAAIYEMYLVWINMDVMLNSKLHLIVPESKYSFPWATNFTIYTTVEYFYLIGQFIKNCKLKKFLCTGYSDSTRLCLPYDIKVAEFTSDIPRDLLKQFRTFLEVNDYKLPKSYFATRAYKFLRPHCLKYYRPYNDCNADTITKVSLLLDYHRDQSKQGVEVFNLFDLIAMKMAIDDNRFEYVNCEFNKLVYQKLNEMSARRIYIKSKRLNLVEYHRDLGIPGYSEELYQYLISQYSGYFDRVAVHEYGVFKVSLPRIKCINDILTGNFKKLEINVSDLKGSNSTILMEILSHENLGFQPIIKFDTSNELGCSSEYWSWNKNMRLMPSRNLKFVGTNSSYFIENFFNWMKQTNGTQYPNFDIKFVGTKISRPYVFRGLAVRMIVIKKMRITCKLLRALNDVKFEMILISKCFVDNDPDIFALLESLSGGRYIQINSDEYTFGILMDSIKRQLERTGLNEFQFTCYITVYYLQSEFEFIDLSRYKFYYNEQRSKILSRDLYTNEVVDIFDYFYRPRLEDLGSNELEF